MNTMLRFLLFAALITSSILAKAERAFVNHGSLQVHYGVFKPKDTPTVGDILFFHGYGDTFENHIPLFTEWNRIGLRIIAFDFPSHGKSNGFMWNDLDWYSFQCLAEIANLVRNVTLENSSRPLFLSGWSTGGLLAIRIVQSEKMRALFPPIRGLVAYAPGVSVRKCVGNLFCHITNDTLTHNDLLQNRTIYPASPLYRVNFAAKLLVNAQLSWIQALPSEIPTLVFVAGDEEDRYVKSKDLKSWVSFQRSEFSAPVFALQCPGAKHELDNEPNQFGGQQVRSLSAGFIDSLIHGRPLGTVNGPCREF
ncbi:MAG: alpha/beta fold hydrolase [Bdellovibrionaceae bacterium]|nr:alpha/beta fold hydrolase [Pseudobdellovibrionaceae bacterium]